LKGWVHNRRDLGGVIFVDLRDQTGITQVVFSPEHSQEALEIADKVRSEYVIEIKGTVVKRDPSTVNPAIQTGTIDRKSTRMNSSHVSISYAVFCLKKKKIAKIARQPITKTPITIRSQE